MIADPEVGQHAGAGTRYSIWTLPPPAGGGAPAAVSEDSESTAEPPAEATETPNLGAALAELRSKPCGDWTAADRDMAPGGYDWGRRDGDNGGEPCE